MTILEAIRRTDGLKHNSYTDAEKLAWLNEVEWMLKRSIIDTHEGAADIAFSGYGEHTDLNTQLLAPAPYDRLYLRWLDAQIDITNGEKSSYNAAISLFNADYEAFENYYARNHSPITGRRFLF